MTDAPYIDGLIHRYETNTIDLATLTDSIVESGLTFGHTAETGEGEWITGSWDTVRRAHMRGKLSDGAFEHIARVVEALHPGESLW